MHGYQANYGYNYAFLSPGNARQQYIGVPLAAIAQPASTVMLADSTIEPASIETLLEGWLRDRAALARMGTRARGLALPDAAATVAGHCLELLDA